MNKASTAGADTDEDDDMPTLHPARFPIQERGSARRPKRKLLLPLSGVRKAAGMTQVQFAEAADITQGEVSRIEAQEDMRISTIRRYAKAVGAEVEVVLTFKDGAQIHLQTKVNP
jgi:DNA-binding XRE family transcriptional regulator